MEDHHDGLEMGMGEDINLMDPDLHIVQDVEADLEAYTRLNRLGRFGEASKIFKETLHRHLGCFAVLAEHCNALLYQGNYMHACLVLSDSIARQEISKFGVPRFDTREMHFLRVVLTYVRMFAESNKFTGSTEAKTAVSQARWYRDTIAATNPHELVDVERQILLICLRILMIFVKDEFASIEDLQLPWSSPPTYPGQTLNLPADYLDWFEALLPQHPWDACIVLQGIALLQHGDACPLDLSIMIDLVERDFPDADTVDVNLFARMLLLGKLCEMTLAKRWCVPGLSDELFNLEMIQIVVDEESERLAEMIRRILREHAGSEDVTETRPYQYLQLLMIDHELIREQKGRDLDISMSIILSRLDVIEKYAASSETLDCQLAMDIIYHHYILQPRKEWRKTMLNKIAYFTSRFGKTQESLRLHSSVLDNSDLFLRRCHPNRNNVAAKIIEISELIEEIKDFRSGRRIDDKSSQRNQSMLEIVLKNVGSQGKRMRLLKERSLICKEPEEARKRERSERYGPRVYDKTHMASYGDTYDSGYRSAYNSQSQPVTVPTSNQPNPTVSYNNPPPVSTSPEPAPYRRPRSRDYRRYYSGGRPIADPPIPLDLRYIANSDRESLRGYGDTIEVPTRPRKRSNSYEFAPVRNRYAHFDSAELSDR